MARQLNGQCQRKTFVKGTTNVILHLSAGFKVLANASPLFPGIGHISWMKGVQFDVVIKGRANARQLGGFHIE